MRNSSTSHQLAEPVEVTAHHMADAISFLMRVATDAGLASIAVKLAGVRASLLAANFRDHPRSGADESTEALDEQASEPDDRHKPH